MVQKIVRPGQNDWIISLLRSNENLKCHFDMSDLRSCLLPMSIKQYCYLLDRLDRKKYSDINAYFEAHDVPRLEIEKPKNAIF